MASFSWVRAAAKLPFAANAAAARVTNSAFSGSVASTRLASASAGCTVDRLVRDRRGEQPRELLHEDPTLRRPLERRTQHVRGATFVPGEPAGACLVAHGHFVPGPQLDDPRKRSRSRCVVAAGRRDTTAREDQQRIDFLLVAEGVEERLELAQEPTRQRAVEDSEALGVPFERLEDGPQARCALHGPLCDDISDREQAVQVVRLRPQLEPAREMRRSLLEATCAQVREAVRPLQTRARLRDDDRVR
jgi:hypothetical protein